MENTELHRGFLCDPPCRCAAVVQKKFSEEHWQHKWISAVTLCAAVPLWFKKRLAAVVQKKETMHLKILLPFKVFADINDVNNIVMETINGSYGLLPQRLDCVAALVPGIFMYETKNDGPQYLAVDAGVMVKAGSEVLVSVRNAIGGVELGKLSDLVKQKFTQQQELETNTLSVTAKLESGFIYAFDKFRNQ